MSHSVGLNLGLNLGIYNSSSSAPVNWTPAELPNLALWLDAADSSTITLNGSTVSQWNDKSGNARHASQATAANQPTYTASGLNGKPVLAFAGNDFLTFSGSHDANWSAVAVAKADGSSQAVFQFGPVNTFGALFYQTNFWYARPGATDTDQAIVELPPDSPAILSATYQTTPTGVTNIWANGSIGTPRAAGSVAASNVSSSIGSLENIYFLTGFISELLVSNGVLSTDNRQRLEGYLAWKWALEANLPSGHPFKNTPPTV